MAEESRKDARALYSKQRYGGTVYLCGYVVELGLKSRICKTLKWKSFPSSQRDFDTLKTFKTHNLEVLLHLSGLERKIKSQHLADWSIVTQWDPELRYSLPGSISKTEAREMLKATIHVLRAI